MKLKKQYRNTVVYLEVLGDSLEIKHDDVLTDIVNSLEGFKFINRDKPFDVLVKEQQKHHKHILVEFDTKPFDELRLVVKAIYNFFVATKQNKSFMLDSVETVYQGNDVVVYSTELFREKFTENTTFAPTIRAHWSKPTSTEKIIKRA